jgi:hypothetical protein
MTIVVKVFLASPNDLQNERTIVRERSEQFNNNWSEEFGIYFRVIGWEDLPPVAQRPQSRINRDADDCLFFIGLLAQRWGSDSGEFSSGFEEEYMSAYRRWKASKIPEIALFFKKVDPAAALDPGPQLSRVLQFKKEIIDGKELLFKEFESTSELGNFVDAVLSEYAKNRKAQGAAQPKVVEQGSTALQVANEAGGRPAVDTSSLEAVISAVGQANTLELKKGLDLWTRLRFFLYSSALYAEWRTYVTIGTHDANLVYRKRGSWKLRRTERYVLFEAMLRDANKYSPGWYWVKDEPVDEFRGWLWYLCSSDDLSKKGAAEILEHDIQLPSELTTLTVPLSDKAIFAPVCKLLERIGTEECLSYLIDARIEGDSIKEKALASAEYAIKSRIGIAIPLSDLLRYSAVGIKDVYTDLCSKVKELRHPEAELEPSKISSERERRALAGVMLDTGKIDQSLGTQLLRDHDRRVRAIGVRALVKSGVQFARSELEALFPKEAPSSSFLSGMQDSINVSELIGESLRLKGERELEALVDFFDADAIAAFSILVELYWPSYKDKVAAYLDCEFQTLIEDSNARRLAASGISYLEIWQKADLVDYRKSDFIQAALNGVLKYNHAKAENWARKYSGEAYSDGVRSIASEILVQVGRPIDVAEAILKFAGMPAAAAVPIIRPLLSNPQITADDIATMASHSTQLVREKLTTTLQALWNGGFEQMLRANLLSKNDNVRMLAAEVLAKQLDRASIEDALNGYTELQSYYYDVTTLFDKVLYAPPAFLTGYLDPIKGSQSIGQVVTRRSRRRRGST